MSKQHRSHLLKYAQTEYESLLYDLAQATAVIPLQQCVLRLAKLVQRLLHDHLLDQNSVMQGKEANPTAEKTPAAPPVLAPQAPHTSPSDSLPDIGNDPRSVLPGNTVQIPGLPPVDIDPKVTNVVVTPLGSKVVAAPSVSPTNAAPAAPADPNGLPPL